MPTTKAIVRGAHLVFAANMLSKHATPRKFCHLYFAGPTARQAYNAIDPAATGLWVAHHPTLGGALPAQYLASDGGCGHSILGVTDRFPAQDGDQPTWDSRPTIEVYVAGHVKGWVSADDRNGNPFFALALTDTTLLDSIKPGVIEYRSDTDQWSAVDAAYKADDGTPLVDPDEANVPSLVDLNT